LLECTLRNKDIFDSVKRFVSKFKISRALSLACVLCSASILTNAQTSAQERAASLRTQLADVEQKQGELQDKLRDLEEDLKPENIEHSLAGVGSTRPEDLREQRRRELEVQKKGLQSQLNQLATSHARLEKAIAEADTQAYQQSARPNQIPQSQNLNPNPSAAQDQTRATATSEKQTRKFRKTKHKPRKRSTP